MPALKKDGMSFGVCWILGIFSCQINASLTIQLTHLLQAERVLRNHQTDSMVPSFD